MNSRVGLFVLLFGVLSLCSSGALCAARAGADEADSSSVGQAVVDRFLDEVGDTTTVSSTMLRNTPRFRMVRSLGRAAVQPLLKRAMALREDRCWCAARKKFIAAVSLLQLLPMAGQESFLWDLTADRREEPELRAAVASSLNWIGVKRSSP